MKEVMKAWRDVGTSSAPSSGVIPVRTEARQYLPGLADLIDRLSIVLLKRIFISDHATQYAVEEAALKHDIDLILTERDLILGAREIFAVLVVMLANRWIWENESTIRDGSSTESPEKQLQRLKGTHSINGVRNTAKNILSAFEGGRQDYKIDCFAAELPPEFGDWAVF